MTTDLLPFASLRAGSTAAAQRVTAEPRTLTLKPQRAALLASREPPMSGSFAVQPVPPEAGRAARAAVLPCSTAALTITF